ncbi:ketoacyl-ACP synthase III [Vibrio sp. SS-MA-C1-2]|uniref:ketoacyl-ACP synthase III n=1 Tax=Vibrio sp. SS-MA-C1-2 TaxID=2908646 RepID=UPI001F3C2E2B|nr:ketoacyl-ACP synthase III [Vibrio sp. SS-MA-C1-2]UJF19966.1 ketoacyl-ACP synthase III [Vibrio sp. SS-MA-C1-2]
MNQTNYFAEITGWGKCLPPTKLSNTELSTFVDTSDQWITSRTGIESRRVSHVETSELAYVAAQNAINCAGIKAEEVDLLIIASCTPDTIIPNIASKVQIKLGAKNAAVFDLNAACSGFIYGLEVATRMIQAGNYRNAIIVGAEHLTWLLCWDKRKTAVLFGDGAGAVVLSRTDKPSGLLQAQLGCDPSGRESLCIPDFGTGMDRFAKDNGLYTFQFNGKDIFKRAVKGMATAAHIVLERAKITNEDIDLVLPHQANKRIIEALCDHAKIPLEKAFINIQQYGNTSAATVPIALCEAAEQGRITPNSNILSAAFGAGLTWGAAYIKWGDRVMPINAEIVELPPCDQSASEILAESIAVYRNLKEQATD